MKKALVSILSVATLLTAGVLRTATADVPDRIVAIVGNEPILKSELDERVLMVHAQYPESKKDPQLRKNLLESIVDQKILLTKAKIDSIKVDEGSIDASASERFASIRSGFPSLGDMEARFGKPSSRIKQDIRDDIRNQQLIDNLRRKHIRDVTVSYNETMEFYKREKDKLPVLPEGVSVSQIIKFPVVSEKAKAAAFDKITEIQNRLKSGESFASLASSFSDDPGSRNLGGDLGFVQKGELVPSFETAAYGLKPGQISGPVETRFGYHIIQLLSKEGNSIHVRHILAAFDWNQRDTNKAIELLSGVRMDVLNGKASFAAMAEKYSDDPMTAKLGGLIKPAGSSDPLLDVSGLKPELQKIISILKKPGEISVPEAITPPKGEPFVAMFQLNSRVASHRLTPESDFARLEALAVEDKRKQLFRVWLEKLRKEVLVRVMTEN